MKKLVPSTGEATIFVYDASGKLVAEYSTIVEPQAAAKTSYLTTDHLGSPRINTDQNAQVTARHDYMPFGEEIGTLSFPAGTLQPRTQGLGYTADSGRNPANEIDMEISAIPEKKRRGVASPGRGSYDVVKWNRIQNSGCRFFLNL